MHNILVAPSMLSADFLHMQDSIDIVNEHADLFHIDIMDAHFAPNLALGTELVKQIATTATKPLDIHFMLDSHALGIIAPILLPYAGYASIHFDGKGVQTSKDTLKWLRSINPDCKLGLAFNPTMSAEVFKIGLENCFDLIDFVLVMGVMVGFSAQHFWTNTYDRVLGVRSTIARVNEERDTDKHIAIEVDGGVNLLNAKKLANCGASILVAGNAVFNATNPVEAIKMLHTIE